MPLSKISRVISYQETTDDAKFLDHTTPDLKPTTFLNKLCILEEAEDGCLVGAGENAIETIVLAFLKPGDHLLFFSYSFANEFSLHADYLSEHEIKYTNVSSSDIDEWEASIRPSTKMVLLQSPSFPLLEIIDLSVMSRMAKNHGLLLVVDNSIASPVIQTPLTYGASLVVHQSTTWINGSNRNFSGTIVGKKKLIKTIQQSRKNEMHHNSFIDEEVLCDNINTAEVRIEKQCSSAAYLCRKLIYHDKISKLHYPGLASHTAYSITKKQMKMGGNAFCIELKGGTEAAHRFLYKLQLVLLAVKPAVVRTHAFHPFSTIPLVLQKKKQLKTVPPGLVCISVGLETKDDILHDILSALEMV